jgi:hypothetical protein
MLVLKRSEIIAASIEAVKNNSELLSPFRGWGFPSRVWGKLTTVLSPLVKQGRKVRTA